MVHATDKSTGYWSRSVLLAARIWIGNKIRKSALGTVERYRPARERETPEQKRWNKD